MRILLFATLTLFLTGNVLAESMSKESVVYTQIKPPYSATVSEGWRLGLIMASNMIDTPNSNTDLQHNLGMNFGYAQINTDTIGFLIQANYNIYEQNEVTTLRSEGSLTYGLSTNFYLMAGVNLQKFTTGGAMLTSLSPRLGYQLGFGAQLSKYFGLVTSFYEARSQAKVNNINWDYSIAGIEVALNATF